MTIDIDARTLKDFGIRWDDSNKSGRLDPGDKLSAHTNGGLVGETVEVEVTKEIMHNPKAMADALKKLMPDRFATATDERKIIPGKNSVYIVDRPRNGLMQNPIITVYMIKGGADVYLRFINPSKYSNVEYGYFSPCIFQKIPPEHPVLQYYATISKHLTDAASKYSTAFYMPAISHENDISSLREARKGLEDAHILYRDALKARYQWCKALPHEGLGIGGLSPTRQR